MMYRSFLIVAIFLAVATATNVQNCAGKPEPHAVRIKGCDNQPCKVVKGTSGEFEIDFTAPHKVSSLKTKVIATALGVTVPYELPASTADVCRNLKNGAKCPLDAEEDVTYKFLFPIANSYPEIPVKVEISLVDEKNTAVSCFAVNIVVTK